MKTLLGDFNAKVGRQDILKLIIQKGGVAQSV
jgi:hypothetical protein